jgi:hypothetical protein
MDDDSKALIKAAAEVILQPVTKVMGDTIGVLGGDRLDAYRKANRAKWDAFYSEEKSKIQSETDTPDLRMAAEILGQAQDENRDELLRVWAKLMAALIDAKRAHVCRREFVEVVRQLEPLDATVLPLLANPASMSPTRLAFIASQLNTSHDQVEVSFRNLLRLELAWQSTPPSRSVQPVVTALGRQLLAVVG